jgi:hypothetical protein
MDPEKVKAIQGWERPQTRRQLQRFLGFSNFYRRFIRNFSGLTKPLHELTRKDAKFKWTVDCDQAFMSLKAAFATAPALRAFDWTKKAVVEVDASNWATGGTLSQHGPDDILYPVAYFSAKHSPQECNYDIYDKELLAIIKALEEWRPELAGSPEFEIITDHKNLQTFATTKELTPRHMRWSEFLSQFNFRIIYKPGSLNTRPDALSRRPQDTPQDNQDDRLQARQRALIPATKFDPETFSELFGEDNPVKIFEVEILAHIDDLINDSYARSDLVAAMAEALRNPEARNWPPALKSLLRMPFAECKMVAGRIYFRDKLFIPADDPDLQVQIISRVHSSKPGGHPGRQKTISKVIETYYWPGIDAAVREFCNACHLCKKTKKHRQAPPGFLKPLPLPFQTWEDISIDYITPLPISKYDKREYQHIAVVVDRLTKMRHFIPTETLLADELADAFLRRIWCLHGIPSTIVSDRGTQFISTFWRALSSRLGTELRPSSAYHPATNGQTERINQELERYLRTYVNWGQDDWAKWLPFAEFAGNNATSETTGVSPFFANYGFHPRMGIEPQKPPPPGISDHERKEYFKANELADRFKAIIDQVQAFSRIAQARYEDNANRHRRDAPKYKAGDWVYLDMANLTTGRPVKKLDVVWDGPFEVVHATSHTVTLNLPENFECGRTFHVDKVSMYHGPITADGRPSITTDLLANEGRVIQRTDKGKDIIEWKFEEILDIAKMDNGRWHYLVKWVGHEPSWQPWGNLKGCDDIIREFHRAHPDKPPPPPWLARKT